MRVFVCDSCIASTKGWDCWPASLFFWSKSFVFENATELVEAKGLNCSLIFFVGFVFLLGVSELMLTWWGDLPFPGMLDNFHFNSVDRVLVCIWSILDSYFIILLLNVCIFCLLPISWIDQLALYGVDKSINLGFVA